MRSVPLVTPVVLVLLLGLAASSPHASVPGTAADLPIAEGVRIEMSEFAFRPATIRLSRGRPVTLRFVNRGQIAHQFETDYLRRLPVTVHDESTRVEGPGLDLVRLQPGGVVSLQFVPRTPGRFAFACTIEGHREAGMTGIMIVR